MIDRSNENNFYWTKELDIEINTYFDSFFTSFNEMMNNFDKNPLSFYEFYKKYLEDYIISFHNEFHFETDLKPIFLFDLKTYINKYYNDLNFNCDGSNFCSNEITLNLINKYVNFFSFCYFINICYIKKVIKKLYNKDYAYYMYFEHDCRKIILFSLIKNVSAFIKREKNNKKRFEKNIKRFNKETFHFFVYILKYVDFSKEKILKIIKSDSNINGKHISKTPDFIFVFQRCEKIYFKPLEVSSYFIKTNNKIKTQIKSLEKINSIIKKIIRLKKEEYDESVKKFITRNKNYFCEFQNEVEVLKTDVFLFSFDDFLSFNEVKSICEEIKNDIKQYANSFSKNKKDMNEIFSENYYIDIALYEINDLIKQTNDWKCSSNDENISYTIYDGPEDFEYYKSKDTCQYDIVTSDGNIIFSFFNPYKRS